MIARIGDHSERALPGHRQALTTPHSKGATILDPLLAQLPVDAAARRELVEATSEPARFYHDVAHLALLWDRHRAHAAEAGLDTPEADRLVACAIGYHDAIYDARRYDNEARSAALWLSVAARCGVPAADAAWVAETIAATADHLGAVVGRRPRDLLRAWFLDLDLTPLAETPKVFARNTSLLRREAWHLTDVAWDESRLAFLRKVAAAPRIFRSPVLFAAYEARARANLASALEAA